MKRYLIILFLGLFTSGCFATKKPEPVIIKIPCHLAELEPMPEIQGVEIVTGDSCSHYICMTESEAKKEFKNDRTYEAYVEYISNTYNSARERCGGNE